MMRKPYLSLGVSRYVLRELSQQCERQKQLRLGRKQIGITDWVFSVTVFMCTLRIVFVTSTHTREGSDKLPASTLDFQHPLL